MGRGKIADKSAVAHFRVDIEHKQFLEDFARKQGRGFSDLARDAVKKYAEALREEGEINRLRESGEFKDLFSGYDMAAGTKDLSLLDEFISTIQEDHEKRVSKITLPEIRELLFDLKLDVAYRYLVFAVRYMAWEEQLKTSLPYLFPESELKPGKTRIKKEARMLKGEIKVGDKLEEGGEDK